MNDLVQVSLADYSFQVVSLAMFPFSAQPEEKRGILQLLLDTFTFYLLASKSINFYVLLVHCV